MTWKAEPGRWIEGGIYTNEPNAPELHDDKWILHDGHMTYEEMLEEARGLTVSEAQRHASVSLRNRHRCHECYTCACVQVLEDALKTDHD